jgi:hypothetical protein
MVKAFIASVSTSVMTGMDEPNYIKLQRLPVTWFGGSSRTAMVRTFLEDAFNGFKRLLVLLLIQQFLQ